MIEYNINLDYNFNCYLDKLSEYGIPDKTINNIKQEIDNHFQLLYQYKIHNKYKELKTSFDSKEDEMYQEAYDIGYENGYNDGYKDGLKEGKKRYSEEFFKLGFEKGHVVGFSDGSYDFNRTDMSEIIKSYYKDINNEEY